MKFLRGWLNKRFLLILLGGVFIGVVLFAGTATGLKATDTADFCSSCHVMDEAHATFIDSNHAALTCNDCHIPQDNLVSKYVFKGKAGMSHMYMNTIGSDGIEDVIHAKATSAEVVNENCISCHAAGLENVDFHDVKDSCIDCHRQVPHGNGKYKPADWFEPGEVDVRS
ncbi:cytochrome c3 family protein [Evansella clarkii]|uniref:cytochrome c3 family protein n=1 Tax=Evansella clarkii TaxID=79879 RepID=UPI000B43B2E3|nr:NapC/NirT family cytochrome c [Evansella clarkii]